MNQRDTFKADDIIIINSVIYRRVNNELRVVRNLRYVVPNKNGKKIISDEFVKDYNKYNNLNN